MALYMQDKHNIRYELEIAQYAEARGFSEIWQADTRLARDCIVMMSAFLTHTKRLRLGSGVLPIWTRNPAVIAASWSTMWELGGKVDGHGRVMLGLGAWWEPIAGRVGVKRDKPLKAMRENVEAIRQLFTMAEVTYQGEFVNLDRVKLDVAFGDTSPRDIPIYIGATGDKMLELAGEICDGVVLNYVVWWTISARRSVWWSKARAKRARPSPILIARNCWSVVSRTRTRRRRWPKARNWWPTISPPSRTL